MRGARLTLVLPCASRPGAEELAESITSDSLDILIGRLPKKKVRESGDRNAGWCVIISETEKDDPVIAKARDRDGAPVYTDAQRLDLLIKYGLVPIQSYMDGFYSLDDVAAESPREVIDKWLHRLESAMLARESGIEVDPGEVL